VQKFKELEIEVNQQLGLIVTRSSAVAKSRAMFSIAENFTVTQSHCHSHFIFTTLAGACLSFYSYSFVTMSPSSAVSEIYYVE